MYEDEDNDGKFPDESPVEVRYPRLKQDEQADRDTWPWLPGSIVEQCGPDEWYVCIEVRELAVLRDGRCAPHETVSRNLYYPCCLGIARSSGRAPLPAVRPRRHRRRPAGSSRPLSSCFASGSMPKQWLIAPCSFPGRRTIS